LKCTVNDNKFFVLCYIGGIFLFDNDETYFEETNFSESERDAQEKIFAGLNPQQVEAVNCLQGPLLIMAGAGSGKTKVLTCRMANLLAHGVSPYRILAITFTNKAAREMKSRAEKMIGEVAKNVFISTFHSFCARILRREIEVTGKYQRNFVIYDSSDSQSIIKECIRQLNLENDRFFNGAVNKISGAKNQLMDAKSYRAFISQKPDASPYDKFVVQIYELYEKKLLENNALDFDDLIFIMVKILRDFDEVREKYQEKFQYILVDEYQDTNMAQYMLTKYLAAKSKNICVVGDADQSIYGWRGADMRNILNFEEDYPDAKVIKLEQNYRSTKQILGAANAVIKKNINRKEKVLWTENPDGEKVKFIRCITDKTEAAFVAREIKRLIEKENFRYNDIAILYRTNAQSRILEERFMQTEIPYAIIGGFKFYERKEIKDIMAYLRLIFNPRDNVSLQRIINVPRRGLGPVNMQRIVAFSNEIDKSIFEIIVDNHLLESVPNLSPKVKQSLHDFAAMIMSFHESQKNFKLKDLIYSVMKESGYLRSLNEAEDGDKEENQSRIENLSSFVNSAEEFNEINQDATLEDFLNHVALISDIDSLEDDENNSRVSMMTIHSAKGLEFPIVFVTGMEEGILPHANSSMDFDSLEEERRACYVALTRAEKKLYLTASCERKTFGKTYYATNSRFVKEISEGCDCMVEYSEKHGSQNQSTSKTYETNPQNYPHRKVYSAPTAHRDAKITVASGKPREKIDWQVGDQAKHRKWGVGTIMEVDGDSIKVVFSNPEVGEKNLKASIAPKYRRRYFLVV